MVLSTVVMTSSTIAPTGRYSSSACMVIVLIAHSRRNTKLPETNESTQRASSLTSVRQLQRSHRSRLVYDFYVFALPLSERSTLHCIDYRLPYNTPYLPTQVLALVRFRLAQVLETKRRVEIAPPKGGTDLVLNHSGK